MGPDVEKYFDPDLDQNAAAYRALGGVGEPTVQELRKALEDILAIEDKTTGGDWDEIEEARYIARMALRRE